MSERVVKPLVNPNTDGTLSTVTPESAGWEYVGFQVVQLAEGQTLTLESGDQELCFVFSAAWECKSCELGGRIWGKE